jgi:hypothetical protein
MAAPKIYTPPSISLDQNKTYTQTYNLIHSANFWFFNPYTRSEGVPTMPL